MGVGWPALFRRYLPPTLAALIAGTAVSLLWLGGTPVIGEVPTGLPSLHPPTSRRACWRAPCSPR